MSITETLKKTIDDLQLDQRIETIAQDLDRLSAQTLESLSGYVASREGDINALVDRIAGTLDARTEGRFAGEIGKVSDLVHGGVAKLAGQGPDREA